jgi:glycosyltransferase involved in cell wall biosynthesis
VGSLQVLVVSHATAPWGAERRILDLAPALAAEGVELVLASPAGELAETWRDRGFAHHPLAVGGDRGLRRDDGRRASPLAMARQAATSAAAAVRVAAVARRVDVDLLHSHALNAHPEVALAGRLAGRPVVLDLHDIVVPGMGRRILDRAAGMADAVIANSRATAATLTRGDVRIVNPGVDTTRFAPGPVDTAVRAQLTADVAAPLVAILGRVDPEKGIDVVLRAVAPLEGVHVVVVGAPNVADASFDAELRALGADLLGDRCRFTGARADVPAVLRSVDVLVNASRAEPFGRTVLEAQASGVPVIGTASGGIPEFVTDDVDGLLVAPGDPQALAAAIARILGDEQLATRLRTGGLANAARIAVPAQAAKVATIYRDVVSDRG